MKHPSKLTIVALLFSLLLIGCTDKAADPTDASNAPTAADETAAINSLFESMKSDMDSILLFPPEERPVFVYMETMMTRLFIGFETDEAKKKEREQGFAALLEAHNLTDALEFSDDEEKRKEMATQGFVNVDLPQFVADLNTYNAKHSSPSSDTDESEAAPVSMQDLTIEGEEGTAVLHFSDGIEFPVVFVKSGGQWFLSWERTYNKPEGRYEATTPMELLVTFDDETSLSNANAKSLLKGVVYDRSWLAELKSTEKPLQAVLSFMIPILDNDPNDWTVIKDEMKQVDGIKDVEEFDRFAYADEGDQDFGAPTVNTSNCENNLKQVGLAFRIWSNDNDDQYPFNVPVASGGTLELCQRMADGFDANAFQHFLVMSNELVVPKLLICPADESTTPAADWAGLSSSHVTYLLRSGPQISEETPNEVLAKCPIHNHTLLCDGVVVEGKQ